MTHADTTLTAQALLFDMDGTLVDSTASIDAVWFSFARKHGIGQNVVAAALPGRMAADIIALVLGPDADIDAEVRWIREQEDSIDAPISEIPGARALLTALPTERWAVVTSATRTMMTRRLATAGLPEPRVTVCAEDVRYGKPDPEGFVTAAMRLGIDIGSAVVFEDSAAGMEAAARAGARCIAIGDQPGEAIARLHDFRFVHTRTSDSGLVFDLPTGP